MGLKDYPSERDQHIVRTFEGVTRSCERIALAKQHNRRQQLMGQPEILYHQMVKMMRDHGIPQTVTDAGEVEDGLQMLAHLIQKVKGAEFRLTRAQQRIADLEAEVAELRE